MIIMSKKSVTCMLHLYKVNNYVIKYKKRTVTSVLNIINTEINNCNT